MNKKYDTLEIFIRKLMIKWTFRKKPCWKCKFFKGYYLDGYTLDCAREGDNQQWDFVANDYCHQFVAKDCKHDWIFSELRPGGVEHRKCKKCGVVEYYDSGSAMYRILGWLEAPIEEIEEE